MEEDRRRGEDAGGRSARLIRAPLGAVVDDGDGFQPPHNGRRTDMCEGGWGLTIVDRLSERWGIAKGAARVWFQMPAEGPA